MESLNRSERQRVTSYTVKVAHELQKLGLITLFQKNEIAVIDDGDTLRLYPSEDLVARMKQLCTLNNLELTKNS